MGPVNPIRLQRILGELQHEWKLFAIATVCSLSGAASAQGIPWMTGRLLDTLVAKGQMDDVRDLLLAMLGFEVEWLLKWMNITAPPWQVLAAILNFLQRNMFTFISFSTVKRLREQCLSNVLHMEAGFFEKWNLGALLSRMNSDSQKLQMALANNAPNFLKQVGLVVFAASMMIYIHPLLALLGLLATPILGYLSVWYGEKVKEYQSHVQDLQAETQGIATDIITNVRNVQSFSREREEEKIYLERSDATFEVRKRVTLMNSCHNTATALAGGVSDVLVLLYAAWLVLVKHPEGGPGPLTVGLLITFRMYMKTCVDNVTSLSRMYVNMQKALGGTERFFDLIDTQPGIPYQGGVAPARCEGRIEFRSVEFE